MRAVRHALGRSLAALPAAAFSLAVRESRAVRGLRQFVRSAPRRSDREGKQAFPGPWPASRQSVPGRDRRSQAVTLVVPDRFGFPTDMGCIGHVEQSVCNVFGASSAQVRLEGNVLLEKLGAGVTIVTRLIPSFPVTSVRRSLPSMHVLDNLRSSGTSNRFVNQGESSDGYRRELESFEHRRPLGQGFDAGQAPRFAADQQPQRNADDGRPRPEQLDDRDGRQGAERQGAGPRAHYEEIVEAKVDLASHLAPSASGVLIDAYYGAWSCVAAGAIGPQTGLLVRVEMSGSPKNKVGAPMGLIEPGWSVEKIKLMGADAVKLLAQYEPTEPISAEHQFQLIEHVYSECQEARHSHAARDRGVSLRRRKENRPGYINRKAATVIDSARQLSRFCDIYKAEFPGTLGHDSDNQLRENLAALNAASERPWVLLSAGVDYPDYYKQVQMALEAGASGVLGGRAFWKEYFLQDGAQARSQFAATTAFKRVADVNTLVRERGTPWSTRYGFTNESLASIRATEGWHARYGSGLGSSDGAQASKRAPGEVY